MVVAPLPEHLAQGEVLAAHHFGPVPVVVYLRPHLLDRLLELVLGLDAVSVQGEFCFTQPPVRLYNVKIRRLGGVEDGPDRSTVPTEPPAHEVARVRSITVDQEVRRAAGPEPVGLEHPLVPPEPQRLARTYSPPRVRGEQAEAAAGRHKTEHLQFKSFNLEGVVVLPGSRFVIDEDEGLPAAEALELKRLRVAVD